MVEIYFAISWWFEYFLQTGIGIAGLVANTLAIPILLSVKRLEPGYGKKIELRRCSEFERSLSLAGLFIY
jgi:hypothetical protein